MQIGPERPDERGRVPATAVASHGTGGTGGHGWGHRRLLAGRFWRLWVPEGLRCEDGVCSGYGVQDARLWCKDWHAACPASPPSHAWVGNGMVLGPSSQCRFSPALLQGSGGLHGAVQTPNPPSETPGVSVGNIQAAGGEQTPAPCSRGDPTAQDVLLAARRGKARRGWGAWGSPRIALFLYPLSKDMAQPLCSSAPGKFNPILPRARCGDRLVALRTR